MENVATINGRTVLFSRVNDGKLPSSFPTENACILVVADEVASDELQNFADTALITSVKYICSAGRNRDELELAFDQRSVEKDQFVMTTSHDDLKEGVWFACKLAHNEDSEITAVVCLLLNGDEQKVREVIGAIKAVEAGWEPED